MKKKLLTLFVREVAASLEKEGHYGTAHVYRSTANSFEKYIAGECACSGNRIRCEKREVTMYSLSPGLLKRYEEWLRLRGLSWDTVGTYLHTLRATYNRGVEAGIAPYVPRLFTGVFTGRASERKRALDVKDVRSIFTGDTGGLSPELERARAFLELMLRFQGMPFVDLAHLQKSDYRNGRLVLHRQKTGVRLSIAVDRRAAELLAPYAPVSPASPYLLDILPENLNGKGLYTAYQSSLRQFNMRLKCLASRCGVSEKVTSYSMRYTWATQSKYCGVPLSVISEGLGHSSIKTTEIYLKRYEDSLLDKANKLTMKYVFEGVLKRFVSVKLFD